MNSQGKGNNFGCAHGGNANLGGGKRGGGNNLFGGGNGGGACQWNGNDHYNGNINNWNNYNGNKAIRIIITMRSGIATTIITASGRTITARWVKQGVERSK